MSDETDEGQAHKNPNMLARIALSSPRNLLLTVCTVIVLGGLLSNSITRRAEQRTKPRTPPVTAHKATSVLIPEETPAEKPEAHKPQETPATQETKPAPDTKPASAMDALNARIEALEGKLKTDKSEAQSAISEAAISQINHTQESLAALEEKIAEQEKTIAALNEQLQNVAHIREEMDAMESRSSQRLTSITLFSQLRDAANHGDSFKPLLDQLLELNKANPKVNALLTQLLPVAGTGLRTMEEMQKEFTDALNATLERNTSNSFMSNLHKLIRIRKIGEQKGMDDESILARAEAALQAGDMQASVKALDALSAESKKTMVNWLRNAQEYINAHNTIAALQMELATATNQPPAAAEEKPEPKPEQPAKPVPAPELKNEPKTEPKTEMKPETKPESAPESAIPAEALPELAPAAQDPAAQDDEQEKAGQ